MRKGMAHVWWGRAKPRISFLLIILVHGGCKGERVLTELPGSPIFVT